MKIPRICRLKLWVIVLFLFATAATGWAADASSAVAVLDFSVPAAESNQWAWAESGVPDLLQIKLQRRGFLVLDRDAIHAVLKEQRLTAVGLTTSDRLSLGKLLNAEYLITGKVIPLAGRRFRVEATVFSVETVETEATATGEGEFPKELSKVLSTVARQIARRLPAREERTGETEIPVRSPKPETLIMFYCGLNACAKGEPDWGAACFMNASALDPDFTAPLLWEIKAYDMAGLHKEAAIRRRELAEALPKLELQTAEQTNAHEFPRSPVLAVLNPVVAAGARGVDAASLGTVLTRSLLATKRVRIFAFKGIGSAVAEQDLRLSSFFTSQNAPRYGRWLAANALVLCRVQPAGANRVTLDLSLINPLDAAEMVRIQRTTSPSAIPGQIPGLVGRLLDNWTNYPATTVAPMMAPEPVTESVRNANPGLRPVYANLVSAIAQVQRQPENSNAHRALADAFAATDRPHLAAYEIEQCLKRLDIHAPNAANTYLGTHRWLFWEPSPARGVVGLVDPHLIGHMIEQLLTTYPKSLAAGCMRYNLAVTAWQGKHWSEAIRQAQLSRQILQSLEAGYDRGSKIGANRGDLEREMIAATYFLEGSSLRQSGKPEAAGQVFNQGLIFMETYKVHNHCLPLGPYIGDYFGSERVYGFGGDPPGIKTRLEQQLFALEGKPYPPPGLSSKSQAGRTVSATNVTNGDAEKIARADQRLKSSPKEASTWWKLGQMDFQNQRFLDALQCYHKAVGLGAPITACHGLAAALLEVALNKNLEHPGEEIEKLRQELGFPPVQASWVEWFAAGRKYQCGHQFDFAKAAACYRGALDFLEHPEKMGIYHLEKEPHSDRTALRRGPTLGEEDLLWSQNYDRRWYSAAFYLAQCLIRLDRKEEAAEWLRDIAINVGGDSAIPLLDYDTGNGQGWTSGKLGVRAAELLQKLHEDPGKSLFGLTNAPFRPPAPELKAQTISAPPLPAVDLKILHALTNTLAHTTGFKSRQERRERLQSLVTEYGHDIVPATLSLMLSNQSTWSESWLIWILEQTATNADAPWVVVAATKHWKLGADDWKLANLAERLDPNATTFAMAEVWQEHEGEPFEPPGLIYAIVNARIRPLYVLVLKQIAEEKENHPGDIFLMDRAVAREKSDELENAFREALADCMKLKLSNHDYYELTRISQVALRHGVAEGIDGLLITEGSLPEKLRNALKRYLDLPANNTEMIRFLRQNRGRWQWNPRTRKFVLGDKNNLPSASTQNRKEILN